MTINKSCKDVGGLSGNRIPWWANIYHHIVALREHQNKNIKKKTIQKHVELGPGRMQHDEADVRNIRTCIDTWLLDLRKHGHPITNFASGEIAKDKMINDIIDLKNRGEVARDEFIQQYKIDESKSKYYNRSNEIS